MKPFIYDNWHAWCGTSEILLSDEAQKKLHTFNTTDDAVNWLYANGYQHVARALNTHIRDISGA